MLDEEARIIVGKFGGMKSRFVLVQLEIGSDSSYECYGNTIPGKLLGESVWFQIVSACALSLMSEAFDCYKSDNYLVMIRSNLY